MKRGWIYHADGTVTEKGVGTATVGSSPAGPYIAPDEGEFVSPIDGKSYSGRAGMREHCKRHDVVNNRDLAGLPYETVTRDYVPDSRAIKETLVRTMKAKGYL